MTSRACIGGCGPATAKFIPRETYDRATEEIRILIAGETLETSNLERFISSYTPSANCGETHPASIEYYPAYCCDLWLNSCQNSLYKLLKRAYSNAIANHEIAARIFLSMADSKLRSNPDCFDCSCPNANSSTHIPVFGYYFSGNGTYGSIEICD